MQNPTARGRGTCASGVLRKRLCASCHQPWVDKLFLGTSQHPRISGISCAEEGSGHLEGLLRGAEWMPGHSSGKV